MASTGTLYAVNITDGTYKSALVNDGSFDGPPTIGYNGLLYIQEIGLNEGINLYGVNMTTLQIQWRGSGSSQWATFPYGTASSDSLGLVYMPGGTYGGVMYAIDSSTGTTKWSKSMYSTGFGCDWWAPSVYEDNRVFFSTQPGEGNSGMIGETDAQTGVVLWHLNLFSAWDGYSTYWVPVVSNDIAFATNRTGSILGIAGVDINAQSLLWTYRCTKPTGFPTGTIQDYSPATDGTYVFFTCVEGLFVFNVADGSLYKQLPCNNCLGQPIVTLDYVIVNSKSGVVILSRTSFETIATINVPGKLAYDAGWLFITTSSQIYAYQLVTS